jgi:hypothetical protein
VWGDTCGRGRVNEGDEGEGTWLVDFIYLHEIKKSLAIAVSGAGKGLRGRDGGGNLTNVQCKPIWNCHNESPLYNEYILIKISK